MLFTLPTITLLSQTYVPQTTPPSVEWLLSSPCCQVCQNTLLSLPPPHPSCQGVTTPVRSRYPRTSWGHGPLSGTAQNRKGQPGQDSRSTIIQQYELSVATREGQGVVSGACWVGWQGSEAPGVRHTWDIEIIYSNQFSSERKEK